MDCVSPILDIFTRLWDCTANRAAYVCGLPKNVNSLRDRKSELEDISKDVESRVDCAEKQQYLIRTNQVKGWLERVQLKLKEVDDILEKGDQEIQQTCMGSCPRHCCTSYNLGKQVVEEIDVVQGLIDRGRFDVVAEKVQRPQIDEIPMEKVVGMDSMFDEVWKCVEDHGVGIIGLCGMGGIGKTTLLKRLNNKFLETSHNFDVVIWVVVSKEVKLGKIQNTLRNKLQISADVWIDRDEEERAAEIWKNLRNKRFVLLLDDLWERLDLLKVGVSFSKNQNEFKIIFTTRLAEVCGQMGANKKFMFTGLSQEAALSLFRQNVGEEVLNSHHEIPKLAEIVAKDCNGLPLALVTIGRAMASRTKPEDWRYAIKLLERYPSRFPEMGNSIFPTLRFSYDSLNDNTLKTCFLYCSLFPEDYNIETTELVNLWIGEGFFDDFDNAYEARERGRYVIETLKLNCLLEESDDQDDGPEDRVKMHDVLRDMAQWLTCEHENEILVKEDIGSIKSQEITRSKKVTRISLYGDSSQFLIETPVICEHLQTIFVMGSQLTTLPVTLFQSMQNLQVLNLSNNWGLIDLPIEIGALKSLYYLNLSKTGLRELPTEVKNLTQLRILQLDDMWHDVVIPPGVISSLSSLKIYSSVQYEAFNRCKVDVELIKELECLEKITEIRLTFSSVNSIVKFMSAPKLQSCIARLLIQNCEELSSLDISSAGMRRMEQLEKLCIHSCPLREVKICLENEVRIQRSEHNCFRNLQILHIYACAAMKNLTWLIYTPRLRSLSVTMSHSLEEIIACDLGCSEIEEDVEMFSNLKDIKLRWLPNLKSICRGAMPFSSLRDVKIHSCPSLRKLPFNAESAKSLNAIQGQRDWWDTLEWEDEATKHSFTSKFQDITFG